MAPQLARVLKEGHSNALRLSWEVARNLETGMDGWTKVWDKGAALKTKAWCWGAVSQQL